MKLVRFGKPGEERPGVWLDNPRNDGQDLILDVRAMAFDMADYDVSFFSRLGLSRLSRLLGESHPATVPAKGVRLGPPIARPGKIVCLGKNYAAHVLEFDSTLPKSPILFAKAGTSVTGPFDPIVFPPTLTAVDWEVELAVLIGKTARRVTEAAAMEYVAGYTVLNDVTDREAQTLDGQWFRAKSADTFCPLGPYLVTRDEIADPHKLRLSCTVNGKTYQNADTSQMIFKIPFIIAFISATITLEPGDVIATGTPAGIGAAQKPPVYLKPGDVVETWVENLGRQVNRVGEDSG